MTQTPHTIVRGLAALLLTAFLTGAPAFAQTDALTLAVGAYDMVRGDDDAGTLGLDYRFAHGFWRLTPWAGLLSTSDAAVWGGAGFAYDWRVTDRLRVTPSFGAGFYEDGIGKDLGHTLEFRSQLDATWDLDGGGRIGINFGHLSNAGLAESNKGTEYFNVTYSVPVGRKRFGAPVASTERVASGSSAR